MKNLHDLFTMFRDDERLVLVFLFGSFLYFLPGVLVSCKSPIEILGEVSRLTNYFVKD